MKTLNGNHRITNVSTFVKTNEEKAFNRAVKVIKSLHDNHGIIGILDTSATKKDCLVFKYFTNREEILAMELFMSMGIYPTHHPEVDEFRLWFNLNGVKKIIHKDADDHSFNFLNREDKHYILENKELKLDLVAWELENRFHQYLKPRGCISSIKDTLSLKPSSTRFTVETILIEKLHKKLEELAIMYDLALNIDKKKPNTFFVDL